jgi:hypothetical protein
MVDRGDRRPLSHDEAILMIQDRKVVVIDAHNGRIEATVVDGEIVKITQRDTSMFFDAKLIHEFIIGLVELAKSVPFSKGKQSHG